MKTFKQALLGLALASCAAVNAYAVPLTDTVFVYGDMSDAGTLVSYVFGEGDATVKAGDTFSYDFLFNTPPSAPTTSFVYLVEPDLAGTVAFFSQDFSAYLDATVAGFTLVNAGNAVFGSGWLDSGVYDLHLTGTFLADGAGFTGVALDDITDLSGDVPEPASLALLGLGLAGLTGARRRAATRA